MDKMILAEFQKNVGFFDYLSRKQNVGFLKDHIVNHFQLEKSGFQKLFFFENFFLKHFFENLEN